MSGFRIMSLMRYLLFQLTYLNIFILHLLDDLIQSFLIPHYITLLLRNYHLLLFQLYLQTIYLIFLLSLYIFSFSDLLS